MADLSSLVGKVEGLTRQHPLRFTIPIRPRVWWYVGGRKMFDKRYSRAVRSMWKVGNYGSPRSLSIPLVEE